MQKCSTKSRTPKATAGEHIRDVAGVLAMGTNFKDIGDEDLGFMINMEDKSEN